MACRTKSYGLSPNWDYPPNGLIQLGNIITNPLKPQIALNKGEIAEIHLDTIQTPDPIEEWETTHEKLRDNSIGLFANITALVGLGSEVEHNYKKDKNAVYKAKLLKTTYFEPENEYLLKALSNKAVKDFIEEMFWKRPIYMITGLKIVEGFSASSSVETIHRGTSKLAADSSAIGVPVTVGLKGGLSKTTNEAVSFKSLPNCVFAYQLIKIWLKRKNRIEKQDYNKHALMGWDEDEEDVVLSWEDETPELGE